MHWQYQNETTDKIAKQFEYQATNCQTKCKKCLLSCNAFIKLIIVVIFVVTWEFAWLTCDYTITAYYFIIYIMNVLLYNQGACLQVYNHTLVYDQWFVFYLLHTIILLHLSILSMYQTYTQNVMHYVYLMEYIIIAIFSFCCDIHLFSESHQTRCTSETMQLPLNTLRLYVIVWK